MVIPLVNRFSGFPITRPWYLKTPFQLSFCAATGHPLERRTWYKLKKDNRSVLLGEFPLDYLLKQHIVSQSIKSLINYEIIVNQKSQKLKNVSLTAKLYIWIWYLLIH